MQLTRVITVIFNAAKPIRRSQLHLHLRNFARGFGDRLLSKRQLAQRAHGGALVRRGANVTSETEVPPSEGNEARREERQEVVAL